MSRFPVSSRSSRHTIEVGWDPPLRTFFAQVEDLSVTDEADDPLVLWVGTSYREITALTALIDLIAPYGDLDSATIEALRRDAAKNPGHPLSEWQRQLLGIGDEPE